jgi:tetratricopeptide (TPR) repeat protein
MRMQQRKRKGWWRPVRFLVALACIAFLFWRGVSFLHGSTTDKVLEVVAILGAIQIINEIISLFSNWTHKTEAEILDGIKSWFRKWPPFIKRSFSYAGTVLAPPKTIFVISDDLTSKESNTIRNFLGQDKGCRVIGYDVWQAEKTFLSVVQQPLSQKADHILFVLNQDFLHRLINTEDGKGGVEEIKRLAARSPSSRQPGKGVAVLVGEAPEHRELLESIGYRRFNSGDEWSIQIVRNMLGLEAPPPVLDPPGQQTNGEDITQVATGSGIAGQAQQANQASSGEIPLPVRIVPEEMKSHNPHFMERKIIADDGRRVEVLKHIHDQFSSGARRLALWGLPGVGKKELAKEYIHSYGQVRGGRRDKRYRIVLWLVASPSLDDAFIKLLERLSSMKGEAQQGDSATPTAADGQNSPPVAPVIDVRKELKKWLKEQQEHFQPNERWLLILEKCGSDDLRALDALLPDEARGDILLIMERRPEGTEGIEPLPPIDPLTDEEGAALLERLCGHAPQGDGEKEAARMISALLGGLPLAIKYATDYLKISNTPGAGTFYRAYLRRCEQERNRLLQHKMHDTPLVHVVPDSVATALNVSLRAIVEYRSDNPSLAYPNNIYRLLVASTLLATKPIPETILQELLDSFQQGIPESQYIHFHDAMKQLAAYSLIESDDNGNTWWVQPAIRMIIDEELHPWQLTYRRDYYKSKVVNAVNAALPQIEGKDWHTCHLYLPHIKKCIEEIEINDETAQAFVHMQYIAGCYLCTYAQYEAKCGMTARKLLEDARDLRERVPGDFYPDLLTCEFALAELDYERLYLPAQPRAGARTILDHKALEKRQEDLEDKYKKIRAAVQNRGKAHQSASGSQDARTPQNVDEANVLYSLARLYDDLGNYKHARHSFQKALNKWGRPDSIRQKLERVTCLCNLAMVRMKEGGDPAADDTMKNYEEAVRRIREARDLLDEVQDMNRDEVEEEQYQTCRAQYLDNYATLRVYGHYELGKEQDYTQIEQDYQDSIRIASDAISGKQGGAAPAEINYLRLVTRWNNLAELYRLQGQAVTSQERKASFQRRALESYRRAIGCWEVWEELIKRHNPVILVVLDNIDALRKSMRNIPGDAAEDLERLMQRIREQIGIR